MRRKSLCAFNHFSPICQHWCLCLLYLSSFPQTWENYLSLHTGSQVLWRPSFTINPLFRSFLAAESAHLYINVPRISPIECTPTCSCTHVYVHMSHHLPFMKHFSAYCDISMSHLKKLFLNTVIYLQFISPYASFHSLKVNFN